MDLPPGCFPRRKRYGRQSETTTHKVVLWKQMEDNLSFGDSFPGVGGKKGHTTTSTGYDHKDQDTERSLFIASMSQSVFVAQ